VSGDRQVRSRAGVVRVLPNPTCLAALHGRVWVTNGDDDSLSIIDCSTDSVLTTVNVGSHPAGVAVDPQSGAFVANGGDGTVTVLNQDHTVRATIELDTFAGGPPHPVGLVNLHTLGMVVVINRDGGVAKIDHGGDLPAISTFFDGGENVLAVGTRSPHGVAVAAGPNPFVYVGSPGVDNVAVFDTSAGFPRRRAGVLVGECPMGVAAHQLQPLVFVANSKADTLSVIGGEAVIATIDVGARPFAVAAGPDARVWVTHDAGMVSMIDVLTNTVTATVDVGSRPEGITVNPDTDNAYVANGGDGTVSVIDPRRN